MSAIRPLATIAILAALGVWLAMQITKGPIAPVADASAEWGDAPAFEAGGAADSVAATEAPAFDAAPPSFPAPPPSPEATTPAAPGLPDLPPLPALPGAAQAADSPSAVDPAQIDLPDLPLPDNIPTAAYPGEAPPKEQVTGRVPSLGTATPDYPAPAATTPPPGVGGPENAYPTAPLSAAPTAPAAESSIIPPAPSGYATARPAIQAALDRDELKRAHLMLTQWYGDPSLSADERREVDRLLSQLAGTVVYSADHRLEPPHQVQPGETLETIAEKYGTPWQLLAKINGVASKDAVQPGQILKVIRGPFAATVDLSDAEIFLTIEGRYAGRFPAQFDQAVATEGAWRVATKAVRYEPGSPAADAQGYRRSVTLSDASGRAIELSAASPPAPGFGPPPQKISVAANDLNDLFDILSEGSQVTVRR